MSHHDSDVINLQNLSAKHHAPVRNVSTKPEAIQFL